MQDALATFGRGARKAIDDTIALNDADTADLFTEISRGVDKFLWMVDAHIQETPAMRSVSRNDPLRTASRHRPQASVPVAWSD
jgi:hypothetical protein